MTRIAGYFFLLLLQGCFLTKAFFFLLLDLSKNRFTEIPPDVWLFAPLETLNLYHNCIKSIPESIKNLQMLTYLNIRWVTLVGFGLCITYLIGEMAFCFLRSLSAHVIAFFLPYNYCVCLPYPWCWGRQLFLNLCEKELTVLWNFSQ